MEAAARFALLLSSVYGFLLFGYLARRLFNHPARYSRLFTSIVLVGTSPFVILNSLWSVEITGGNAVLPLIQIALQLLCVFPALLIARAVKADRGEKGAVISCAIFSNTGPTLGMVVCYALFGDQGLYLAGWFIVLFAPIYYLVAFPFLSSFSPGRRVGIGESLRNLGSNPVSLVPMLFTVAGILLNFSGLPRPWVLNYIANRYMTYISAAGFSFAIGLGFDLRVSLGYRRHALLIALVKFVFTPLAALALTAAFGLLGGLETGADPLPALVVLVESAMPTAILALVAVKLFGLNEHLANAAWIFTTLLAIGVIGLQFAVLRWAVPYLF